MTPKKDQVKPKEIPNETLHSLSRNHEETGGKISRKPVKKMNETIKTNDARNMKVEMNPQRWQMKPHGNVKRNTKQKTIETPLETPKKPQRNHRSNPEGISNIFGIVKTSQ